MVRLFVVFLQNIIKLKVINLDEIAPKIKNFCLEHNQIQECQIMLKKVIAEASYSKDTQQRGQE
jgi:hypothetical protein